MHPPRLRTAVFIDRDGTINEEVGYLDDIKKLRLIPGAAEAIRRLNMSGMLVIVVTNQSGIARGFFDETFVEETHRHLRKLLHQQAASIDAFYFCPHHPEGNAPYRQDCLCRKPEPGMLLQAAKDWNIDLRRSFMIGDKIQDVDAGQRAGAQGILVQTGYGQKNGSSAVQPDYTAENILAAVDWILRRSSQNGMART